MNKCLTTLFTVILLFGSVSKPAYSADCNSIAAQTAESSNAELLNVVARSENGNTKCDITLRIPGQNGNPPRVVTKTVNG